MFDRGQDQVMSSHPVPATNANRRAEPGRESELQQIREALQGLRYGTVQVIVQDGVVVQIDRTEKRRLHRRPIAPATESCT